MGRKLAFLSALLILACSPDALEEGVSAGLAAERAGYLSELAYSLDFDLTAGAGSVAACDTVRFTASRKNDVVLDFKAGPGSVLSVEANGRAVDAVIANEHLTIPRRYVREGRNVISIKFIAGEQSLNRRDEFLYTLLVPDRARTLFPCFDQPDLKAEFNLTLKVPDGWVAVSNTEVCRLEDAGGALVCRFSPTKPLSTYLFSFVAGRFERIEETRNGRTISMYHRETDPARIAQSEEIFRLVFDSLEWMEDYTGVPYPFSKYDFVVLPDFQYGGMEHAGATLYNDKRMFLGSHPTTDELLDRASLIAHETSHMWFGDYVTMRWFSDVWTKEVFANWFAGRIMRPAFPSVNHVLSDLKYCYAPAYSEDRTRGSNAIQRPLDNLQDAGLIYCNIIYDKAPVVMDKLHDLIGPEKFREGMREYLSRFGYSNASWDDLVDILDGKTETDLKEWSEVWIKEAGMPVYRGTVVDGRLTISQEDPTGRGLAWQQTLNHRVEEDRYWIPNVDGKGYGWFRPDEESMEYIMEHWPQFDETARMSLLMTLYENSWHGVLDRKTFVEWCGASMNSESNPLILSSMISYAASESLRCPEGCPGLVTALRSMSADPAGNHEFRLMAFRQLFNMDCGSGQMEELYGIWKESRAYPGLEPGERDYTDLACQLMVAFPERASEIAGIQAGRISNPDRRETFEMLCRAASPDMSARRSLFESFIASAENRRPESRVLSALALLCHHSRQAEAEEYIIPSLDALSEIQRTGDIFFPASWCRTLLKNQHGEKAMKIVDDWLTAHPRTNPLLVTKILQACE